MMSFTRERLISGAVSVALHGMILIGGGVLFTSPVEYGVEAGEGGLDVHLIAALPAAGQPSGAALDPLVAPAPSTIAPPSAKPTPYIGDGSSPVPGPDATTLHATGGARSRSGPSYIRNPAPPYPAVARAQGQEGTVILRAEFLPKGRGGQLQVQRSSGFSVLDDAALQSVARWQFKPAHRGGPVAVWVEIPITFRLVEGGE
jgi:protein TonB